MPPNCKAGASDLPTLTQYCKQQNIPFSMNERRFYLRAKHEHSKNSFYHGVAALFHSIELRNASMVDENLPLPHLPMKMI